MSLFPRSGTRSARLIAAAVIWLAAARGVAVASHPHPRPGSSIPILTLTSSAAGPRAIEARMAQFILLLQANHRAAAARLLSRRMDVRHRRAFVRGQWLTRNSASDFGIVYFLPAIRVRTRGMSGGRALVRVEPLSPYTLKYLPIGFIDVPMYHESGRWQVNPTPLVVHRVGKPAGRAAAGR